MTEYRRNIAVGLTAAVALCGVAYMIMLFGNTPIFARRGYAVRVRFSHAGNLDRGSDVRLNGIRVGTVADVRLGDDPHAGVVVELRIDRDVRIPADVKVSITRAGLGGGGYVEVVAPPEKVETPTLPTDGSAEIEGVDGRGEGFLGPELMTRIDRIVESVEAFRRLADSLDRIAGDPANQANIKQMLANLRSASAEASDTAAEFKRLAADARGSLKGLDEGAGAIRRTAETAEKRIDELADGLIDDVDRLGRLLTTLNQAADSLNDTDGAAGKFLHDPALYNGMLESVEMLSKTLAEIRATLKKWRETGLKIHL